MENKFKIQPPTENIHWNYAKNWGRSKDIQKIIPVQREIFSHHYQGPSPSPISPFTLASLPASSQLPNNHHSHWSGLPRPHQQNNKASYNAARVLSKPATHSLFGWNFSASLLIYKRSTGKLPWRAQSGSRSFIIWWRFCSALKLKSCFMAWSLQNLPCLLKKL